MKAYRFGIKPHRPTMSSKNLIGIAVAKRVHQFHFRDGFFPTLFGAGFLDDRRSGRAGGGGSVGRRDKNEGRRGRRHGGSFGDVGDGVNLSRVGHFDGGRRGEQLKPIDRTGDESPEMENRNKGPRTV